MPSHDATAGDPPRAFDALLDDLLADEFAAEPTRATMLGVAGYDDRLPDLSASAIETRERESTRWYKRFADVDPLALDAVRQVDRELVLHVLRGREVLRDWQGWRRDPDTYVRPALDGVFELFLQADGGPGGPVEEARAAAARLGQVPEVLAAGRANLDPELASPVLVRRALPGAQGAVRYFRELLPASLPDLADDRARSSLLAAAERAADAYAEFARHLETLAGSARGGFAIGEARYDGLLAGAEGLPLGARELREQGADAHAELAAELRALTRAHRDDDDWQAWARDLADDRPATPDDMLTAYREATAEAREFTRAHELVTFAEGEECDVVPAPEFLRGVLAVAYYISPPALRGGRRGHFFVPFPPSDAAPDAVAQRLATNNAALVPSTAVHEAYPGHHWQLSWFGATNARRVRYVFGSSYMIEGWALYAERLLREQGFFTDPRAEFGCLLSWLFRAARVVVDTSLHLGEMTPDEAVDYLIAHAPLSRGTAEAEVARYCAWPTQAASYHTGAVEILRLRGEWLGAGRELRAFHDLVGGSGGLPLGLLARVVREAE